MIRPIDIRLNAAHPELKLPESVTYTGSPSTVLIRGVPPNYGRWAITAVSVAATFPDGSTTTRAAVQSANGVWVATLPGTATSGRTTDGFRVIADGIDENGEAVTGYILAVADFAVASLDVTPAPQPGETSWQMLYFDAVPSVLRKGDVTKIDGVLKFYDGEAWEAFAGDIPAPSTATPAMDGTGAAGSSAAYARGDHVHPSDTSKQNALSMQQLANIAAVPNKLDASNGVASGLVVAFGNYGIRWGSRSSTEYTLELVARPSASSSWTTVRSFYIPQATTGNLALVEQIISKAIEAIAPEFSILYSYKVGQLVRKDGILYICTAEHTDHAWDPSHFSANATVESALAVIRAAIPTASTSTPLMDGTGSAGSSAAFARGDHRHPSDSAKLDKSGGTMTGGLTMGGGNLITFSDSSSTRTMTIGINSDSFEINLYSYGTLVYTWRTPYNSGVFALASELLSKLDASSASAPFSSDSSVSYPVGSHCTYQGKLYKCTTATTGGTWVAGSWAEDTMTDPDAVLDITSQNQLRVVAKDGTLLWAQGYDLASTSSATLACDAVNNFTFADGATSQAFALPTAPTGKAGDFGLDIDNSANTSAVTMTLTGLDTTFSIVVPGGESLNDMLAIAAGELARFYITLSSFRVNNLPTWHIVKQVVENGGATV